MSGKELIVNTIAVSRKHQRLRWHFVDSLLAAYMPIVAQFFKCCWTFQYLKTTKCWTTRFTKPEATLRRDLRSISTAPTHCSYAHHARRCTAYQSFKFRAALLESGVCTTAWTTLSLGVKGSTCTFLSTPPSVALSSKWLTKCSESEGCCSAACRDCFLHGKHSSRFARTRNSGGLRHQAHLIGRRSSRSCHCRALESGSIAANNTGNL